MREVTISEGTNKVATFNLKDETGRIKVTIWRKLANAKRDLPIGKRVRLENVFVKKSFSSEFELTSSMSTSIKALVED